MDLGPLKSCFAVRSCRSSILRFQFAVGSCGSWILFFGHGTSLGGAPRLLTTLERHDVIAFTETWLNDTVATSELGLGLGDHTWFRRDRGSLGGGVACAVRSSLLPLRLPDPVDTETLLVRLRAVSVTLAVIYRPPDDDAAMERIADALSAVQPPDCRLVAVGDLNVPELSWTPAAGDADGAVPTERRAACDQASRHAEPARSQTVGVPAH